MHACMHANLEHAHELIFVGVRLQKWKEKVVGDGRSRKNLLDQNGDRQKRIDQGRESKGEHGRKENRASGCYGYFSAQPW